MTCFLSFCTNFWFEKAHGKPAYCSIREKHDTLRCYSPNIPSSGNEQDADQPCFPPARGFLHFGLGGDIVRQKSHIPSPQQIRIVLTSTHSAIAAAGGGLSLVSPAERAFSLLDLSISYPVVPELISTGLLAIVCLAAPAVIIAAVVAIFVPGPTLRHKLKRREVIAFKLWEWEKGWAGLGKFQAYKGRLDLELHVEFVGDKC